MIDTDAIALIAGLGNPGPRYQATRHNAGFWFADALADRYRGRFRAESRFQGQICRIDLNNHLVWLLRPDTFVNRSGQALRPFSDFYKIPPRRILVAHDEIDLPPGVARLKFGGGHGGHNGLRDIVNHLGPDFWRLRLGVGHPGHRDQVVDYVLSAPPVPERDAVAAGIDDAIPLVDLLVCGEMEKAMHRLHSQNSPDPTLSKGGKKEIPPFGKGGRGGI